MSHRNVRLAASCPLARPLLPSTSNFRSELGKGPEVEAFVWASARARA